MAVRRWRVAAAGAAWLFACCAAAAGGDEAAARPVQLIELPPDAAPGLAGQRRHHALSVRSELPERMLRSIGVEASECSTRFRAPSRLRQDAGGNTSVVVQAQIGLACRF